MSNNNGNLINRKNCKEFTLKWAQANRAGWRPTQVSEQFIDDLNARVRLLVQGAVDKHRSVGRTVKDLF